MSSNSKRSRFGVPGALTQGIGQALQQGKQHAGQMHYELVPLSRIDPDPDNPRQLALNREDLPILNPTDPLYARKSEELENLQGLATSIRGHGVQQAIVVYRDRERFRIAMGERRFLASILAEKEVIPARIWPKRPDEFELRTLQYIENVQRADLSAWERVQNIKAVIAAHQEQFGEELNVTKLAEITGLAISQASLYVQLVNAPDDVRTALAKGEIKSLDKAAMVAKLSTIKERNQAIEAIRNGAGRQELRPKKQKASVASKGRAGRPTTKIALGSTHNARAVRHVVDTMATRLGIEEDFRNVDWHDYVSVHNAWVKMWRRLESLK